LRFKFRPAINDMDDPNRRDDDQAHAPLNNTTEGVFKGDKKEEKPLLRLPAPVDQVGVWPEFVSGRILWIRLLKSVILIAKACALL
jgi:hypothetical protein